MVEEILPNLYRIEIPLPRSPLKALNSYVIKSPERTLIIDTGWNRDECRSQMMSGLEKINVDLSKTDFFITHCHADHIGLLESLATDTSVVYFNRQEVSMAGAEWHREQLLVILSHNGFPVDEARESLSNHPGRRWGLKRHIDFRVLQEGDTLEIGDYSLRCIETPGHSPGHMCLYEADKKLLFGGDHILFDITPNIQYWTIMENSLGDYLASLHKVYNLDVNLVLPGHRRIWSNHRTRIAELIKHHELRASEVLGALKEGEKSAFEVAPYITWDVGYPSWDKFPISQKWFAMGETLAHLVYLEKGKLIQRQTKEQKVTFSLLRHTN